MKIKMKLEWQIKVGTCYVVQLFVTHSSVPTRIIVVGRHGCYAKKKKNFPQWLKLMNFLIVLQKTQVFLSTAHVKLIQNIYQNHWFIVMMSW